MACNYVEGYKNCHFLIPEWITVEGEHREIITKKHHLKLQADTFNSPHLIPPTEIGKRPQQN
jgi:hypothetical protein